MNRTPLLYPLGILLLLGAAPPDALARIKLTTLPVRERVEIQLDHAQIALVEEERIVPLVRASIRWIFLGQHPHRSRYPGAAHSRPGG